MNDSLRRTFYIVTGIITSLLTFAPVSAQTDETPLPRIDRFLSSDGTFRNAGDYSGSIDARGWRIQTAPDGTPRFVRNSESELPAFARPVEADDDYWDDRFANGPGSSGVDDEVFALAADGKRLYVGGVFTKAGDVAVNNIATWDGTRWQLMGTGPGVLNGVNGSVNAIAVDGDIVYVGGQFTSAGAAPVQNIARYSISSHTWAPLTTSNSGISGLNAFVSSILIDGDNVYIGGTFTRAGTVQTSNIARWNKATKEWNSLGIGIQGNVNALAKGPDGIYVGGSFSAAGGVTSSSIARWDGTTWHTLAGGVSGPVNAIAVLGNSVFVGGDFDHAGDTAVNNIARWRVDSAIWSRLTGLYELVGEYTRVEDNGVHDVVRTIVIDGNNVYVGGTFRAAFPGDQTLDPVNANYIARWFEPTEIEWWQTNTWWASLGRGARNGTNGFVNALALYDGELYSGGAFSRAGGQDADGIAKWDGIRWLSLATGVNNFIFNLTITDNGEVYVGGEINQAGAGQATGLAKLNDALWQPIYGTINGTIYTLASQGDWIYVGGHFTNAGGVAVSNVARWNRVTSEWSALGANLGPTDDPNISYVSAIAIDGDDVYLGGQFTTAGGISAANIVRWNSATDTWTNLGSGINGSVFSIIVKGDQVYAGGRFLGAGTTNFARNVALWQDGDWHDLDSGTSQVVWSMQLRGSDLIVGGEFTKAGTVDVNHLAIWNTESKVWSDIGGGVNSDFLPVVNSIALNDNHVYVGGTFTSAGEQPVSNIASWDGGGWNSLGSGVDSYVYEIRVYGSKVYVAGAFTEAGAKPSFYFGIYTDPTLSLDEDIPANPTWGIRHNIPNPFTSSTTISFNTRTSGPVNMTIYDLSGKVVARLIDSPLPAGIHQLRWSPESVSSAIYFCRLEADGKVQTIKMVKQ